MENNARVGIVYNAKSGVNFSNGPLFSSKLNPLCRFPWHFLGISVATHYPVVRLDQFSAAL
jgi:hypothetical protein